MIEIMDDGRMRAKRKLLKVTFPNGKNFCYKNVTATMIDVLKEIGEDRFPDIGLEIGHLPIISKEVYPKYRDWMKPIINGWYLNTQSNTDTKYLQLKAISDSLGLALEIELGEDLAPTDNPSREKGGKTKDKLLVRFPDGEFIANDSSLDTFLESVWKIGIADVSRRNILWADRPLITNYKAHNRQVQIDTERWIEAPSTTKDRAKLLRVIALHLKLNLDITII